MRYLKALLMIFTFFMVTHAHASKMRFQFTHPTFGGNPFNASNLQNLADIQNQHQEPINAGDDISTLDGFTSKLEQQILVKTISDIATDLVGGDSSLINKEFTQVGNLTFDITQGQDGLQFIITDVTTGALSIINIGPPN